MFLGEVYLVDLAVVWDFCHIFHFGLVWVPLCLKDSKGKIACGNNNTSNCARTVDQSDKLMDVDSVLLVESRLGYCPSIVTVVLHFTIQSDQTKRPQTCQTLAKNKSVFAAFRLEERPIAALEQAKLVM